MEIVHSPAHMHALACQGETLALVPTMGNLHAGHLSLVDRVKPLANKTVVSIFVNPTQFGPNEDFANYPRTLEADCKQLKARGVDYVFAPAVSEMVPKEPCTFVKVPGLSDILCGASRPGHFQGVATIVCKLFQVIQPKLAIFGEKDYQQLVVIRRMVADLSIPVEIIGAPIIREPNGLAMSSRNQYLTAEQKNQAALLYQTLQTLVQQAQSTDHFQEIIHAGREQLNQAGFKTDYLAIRRQSDLEEPQAGDKKLIALGAAFLGKTRLIDNILFDKV